MAAGIVKEINSTNRSYYMVNDITELLGISRSKAYEMIRTMRKECIASGKWIFQAMGKEMDDAHLRIEEELPYQAFPETATWGLRYHEEKYGLPVRENLSYEERRKLILEKRNTRAPMNPYMMEKILENIIGRKVYVNDEDTPINTFTVEIEPGDNAVDVIAAIKKLKEIKQSHVAFTFSFTSLARIEICGHTQKWKTSYAQCGTTPMVSNGLGLSRYIIRM